LIALFDRREKYHAWANSIFEGAARPIRVCEPVLTESLHLLRHNPAAQDALLELVEVGSFVIPFALDREIATVRALRAKYADVPMSLADACIVRMAELFDDHAVCTLDADFRIYRKHSRQAIPLLTP
jgi:predicted nucleic acid-binding protein